MSRRSRRNRWRGKCAVGSVQCAEGVDRARAGAGGAQEVAGGRLWVPLDREDEEVLRWMEVDERMEMWEGVLLAVVVVLLLAGVVVGVCGLVGGCGLVGKALDRDVQGHDMDGMDRARAGARGAQGHNKDEVVWLQENWAAGRYGDEMELD